MISNNTKLQSALNELISQRNPVEDLKHDPLSFVHRYQTLVDREIAAVFAATLAYGRVALFFPVIANILDLSDLHGGPENWIRSFSKKHLQPISSYYYRLNKHPDFALLALGLQGILEHYPSVYACFKENINPRDYHYDQALEQLIQKIKKYALHKGQALNLCSTLPKSFLHMLSLPSSGSACKRWNMFLRWMIRQEYPDLGCWPLSPSKLTIPLDTHVHKISLLVGLCKRKSANMKTAKEISNNLRKFDAYDPIRYDFGIAHMGISGKCQKKHIPAICSICPLEQVCTMEAS